MTNEETLTLPNYISLYEGYTKFARLEMLIQNGTSLEESLVQEAIILGYKLATDIKNIGMFIKIQKAAKIYFTKRKVNSVPPKYDGSSYSTQKLLNEYNQVIKNKETDIQRQMKTLIKDSLRISFKELG